MAFSYLGNLVVGVIRFANWSVASVDRCYGLAVELQNCLCGALRSLIIILVNRGFHHNIIGLLKPQNEIEFFLPPSLMHMVSLQQNNTRFFELCAVTLAPGNHNCWSSSGEIHRQPFTKRN